MIVADRSFGHAGHQLRQSITLPGNLVVGRFGTSCYTHTDHHIDRFGDSDHLGLVCNHGLVDRDKDTALEQCCSRLSLFLRRQRMTGKAHLIFYSSNSLVLIPPPAVSSATAVPAGIGTKNTRFLKQSVRN